MRTLVLLLGLVLAVPAAAQAPVYGPLTQETQGGTITALQLDVATLTAKLATIPTLSVDSNGILSVVAPDGSIQQFVRNSYIPAGGGTGTPTNPATYTPVPLMAPSRVYVLDPYEPLITTAPVAGTPAIQVDGKNNVLAMTDAVSGVVVTHGSGEVSIVPNGPNGFPYFHGSSSTSVNQAANALVFKPSAGTPLFTPTNEPFHIVMVARENAMPSFVVQVQEYSSYNNAINVYGLTVLDGALRIEQNNTAAGCNEPSSTLTAFGVWQRLEFLSDGNTLSIFREGQLTCQSPSAAVGNFVNLSMFELLNAANMDVAYIEMEAADPSINVRNSDLSTLGARFGLPNVTVTQGSAGGVPQKQIDNTQYWNIAPNWPVSDIAPTSPTPSLASGLALSTGAVSKAHYDFTPTGNVNTRALLDADFYYLSGFGDQDVVTGEGLEGDIYKNYTRKRTYPATSPYNLLNFTPTGLNLGTTCSLNNTAAGCVNGGVYGEMLRPPTLIYPGDIVEITLRMGGASGIASRRNYFGAALYAETQYTPGPGGQPYSTKNGGPVYGNGNYNVSTECGDQEHDVFDLYYDATFPAGQQLKTGVIAAFGTGYQNNNDGACFKTAPHEIYDASGSHVTYEGNGPPNPMFSGLTSGSLADGFYTFTMAMTNDGSNVTYFFVTKQGTDPGTGLPYPPIMIHSQYYEPALGVDSGNRPLGYMLELANQAIPTFLNTSDLTNIQPNDGGPIIDGAWSATIQRIDIITGAITPAALTASMVDPNVSTGKVYPNTTNFAPTPVPPPPTGEHEITFGNNGQSHTVATAGDTIGANSFTLLIEFAPTATDLDAFYHAPFGDWGQTSKKGWVMMMHSGQIYCQWGDGTTAINALPTASEGLTAGTYAKVECDIDPVNKTATYFTFPGGTKTQLGATVAVTAAVIPAAPTGSPALGQMSDGNFTFFGSVAQAMLTVGGTAVLAPVATATGITDGTGAAWITGPQYGSSVAFQ